MGVKQKAIRLLSLFLIGLLSLIPLTDAAAQDGGGVIRGGVFHDENGDGLWDGEELPLEGVSITLTGGIHEYQLNSAADGAFYLEVPFGDWQGVLHPTEGFTATNDTSRQVSLSAEGMQEAVMNFGLIRTATDQSQSGAIEDAALEDSLGEESPSEADDSASPANEGEPTPEVDASEESAYPGEGDLDLLANPEGMAAIFPLSGSASLLLLTPGALALLLAFGFLLIRVAHRIR